MRGSAIHTERRRDQQEGREVEDEEAHVYRAPGATPWKEFQAGGRCLGRVVLYHALVMLERRMLARCKVFLKRLRCGARTPGRAGGRADLRARARA